MDRKNVAIACQGGGSQCAFVAGALQALFDREIHRRFKVVGLSGTSGGALTAALAWYGLLQQARGDRTSIAKRIDALWSDLTAQTPQEIMIDAFCTQMLRLVEQGLLPSVATSPSSPRFRFGVDLVSRMSGRPEFTDLKALLVKHLDFAALPSLLAPDSPVLLVGAGDVLEGEFKVFSSARNEIKVESLQASAAIPNLFPAIWVDGHAYWDGIFATNPPVFGFLQRPLMAEHPIPDEIWIIQVNRRQAESVPEAPSDIFDRRNHLAGNLSLGHELRMIEMVNMLLRENALTDEFRARFGLQTTEAITVRFIRMSEQLMKGLDYPSKLSRQPAHIARLKADGMAQAERFLAELDDAEHVPAGAERAVDPLMKRAVVTLLAGAWALLAPEAQADGPTGSWQLPHYDDGFVLISSPESDPQPFRLKLKHVSQFKYTNTLNVNETYVDHLGNEKEVLQRHDIQLTRDVFYFSGYAFDRRLDFNILLYTSSATLSATAAGFVGFAFHDAFKLRAGFFSLPSLRSMSGTYPFFPGTDRSMAVNYMRPGFTQGIWAEGTVLPGLSYIGMVGNSLNTLDISATRIDHNFAYALSVWYDHNQFGLAWNDWEHHDAISLRIGTAGTFAREDRLSDLSTASPENNATYISDGNLLFGTGSLAPGVTVQLANFYLWAVDIGLKFRGLAFNVELYQRWLNEFEADGPLPLDSMHDWGFEACLGYFVFRSRLELYARTSYVNGPFNNGIEGGGGFQWYPFATRHVWINLEVMQIEDSPYGSVLYVYSAGQSGTLVQSQFLLRF